MIMTNRCGRFHTAPISLYREVLYGGSKTTRFRCPYQANVMKIFEIVSNTIVCMRHTPPSFEKVGILSLGFKWQESKCSIAGRTYGDSRQGTNVFAQWEAVSIRSIPHNSGKDVLNASSAAR